MANKKALGRGLRALIPDIPPDEKESDGAIQFVEVLKIAPNPFQPRATFDPDALVELKQSIAQKGLVQPVTVRKHNGGYQLISGERRLRAVRDLGIDSIPAFIMDVRTDEEMLELAIIENIHREDLNPIDIARGYKRLIDECDLTQEDVATKVGKDRTSVTNFLRLLKLPRRIQESLQSGELTMGHARALLSLNSSEKQIELWKRVVKHALSVRKVEDLVRQEGEKPKKRQTAPKQPQYYYKDAEDRLRVRLATKVSVKATKDGGRIEIDFYSGDELERIIAIILEE